MIIFFIVMLLLFCINMDEIYSLIKRNSIRLCIEFVLSSICILTVFLLYHNKLNYIIIMNITSFILYMFSELILCISMINRKRKIVWLYTMTSKSI